MNLLWIVFVGDDDGFIGGIFDNEDAADECYKYYCSHMSSDTHIFSIDPENFKSNFVAPQFEE